RERLPVRAVDHPLLLHPRIIQDHAHIRPPALGVTEPLVLDDAAAAPRPGVAGPQDHGVNIATPPAAIQARGAMHEQLPNTRPVVGRHELPPLVVDQVFASTSADVVSDATVKSYRYNGLGWWIVDDNWTTTARTGVVLPVAGHVAGGGVGHGVGGGG